ncbi:hypothetical protein CONCODRAFT_74249 [Conidiobolus coronatus NRRL 28638]|uniref:Uncharacterized protein n=1 Tax=Conidiobolus coronatus (strain ATCC 28846 / CBS 209.66 / NRRL 28638) TaxID=796925 RepID=A0A137NRZ3_CONC2|nr:hypothetical protein CONCODRAFT_74249 [Conidiobolus coronatus NRRL 28638]|eukprot:KXN65506.1 hypothetical protein CONCODRAFT_74249 [Conidiobolus coronatus NRRL 28638]
MKLIKLTLILPILSASIGLERREPGLLDSLLNNSPAYGLTVSLGSLISNLSVVLDTLRLGYVVGNLSLDDIILLLGKILSPARLDLVVEYLISENSQVKLNDIVNNLNVHELTSALDLDIEDIVKGLGVPALDRVVKYREKEGKKEMDEEETEKIVEEDISVDIDETAVVSEVSEVSEVTDE